MHRPAQPQAHAADRTGDHRGVRAGGAGRALDRQERRGQAWRSSARSGEHRSGNQADMPVTVAALGTVQPIVTATVRTQLSGVLFKILFQEGQMVRQGQVLAQIDPRPYKLALDQARANLARDEAQLSRPGSISTATRPCSSRIDRQPAGGHPARHGGPARRHRGRRSRRRRHGELNLQYTAVKAPISGRIGIRQVDIGNYLTPSDTNGMVVITQVDPIDVSFAVPQAQLAAIGQSAGAGRPAGDAKDQSNATRLATGRFLTFDNQIDTTTGTVKAKARFANAGNVLFPGAFVNVSMLVQTLHDVVTVPVSAVRHGSQGDFVFVVKPTTRSSSPWSRPAPRRAIALPCCQASTPARRW
jgi:multidrug efflux system membrane fusion protein